MLAASLPALAMRLSRLSFRALFVLDFSSPELPQSPSEPKLVLPEPPSSVPFV